jgi:hypothetical protein
MKIQNVSTAGRQNFGENIVLESASETPWELDDLKGATSGSEYRMDWFVTDKSRILVSIGNEKEMLDSMGDFVDKLYQMGQLKESQQVDARLHGLVRTYGQIAQITRAFAIKTLGDLRKIRVSGFEDLAKYVGK